MTPKIGDELVVKVRDGKIVSMYAVTFDVKQTVQVVFANNVSGEYLCYIPQHISGIIKDSFKITQPTIVTYKLKKSFLNHDAVIVRRDCITKLIVGPDGATCKKCDTFIQYAIGHDFICYSCRENPYPSWKKSIDQ